MKNAWYSRLSLGWDEECMVQYCRLSLGWDEECNQVWDKLRMHGTVDQVCVFNFLICDYTYWRMHEILSKIKRKVYEIYTVKNYRKDANHPRIYCVKNG
jgi:hypothetical protein